MKRLSKLSTLALAGALVFAGSTTAMADEATGGNVSQGTYPVNGASDDGNDDGGEEGTEGNTDGPEGNTDGNDGTEGGGEDGNGEGNGDGEEEVVLSDLELSSRWLIPSGTQPVRAGTPVAFAITATNAGPGASESPIIDINTAPIFPSSGAARGPETIRITAISSPAPFTCSITGAGTATCDAPSLAKGATATIVVRGVVTDTPVATDFPEPANHVVFSAWGDSENELNIVTTSNRLDWTNAAIPTPPPTTPPGGGHPGGNRPCPDRDKPGHKCPGHNKPGQNRPSKPGHTAPKHPVTGVDANWLAAAGALVSVAGGTTLAAVRKNKRG